MILAAIMASEKHPKSRNENIGTYMHNSFKILLPKKMFWTEFSLRTFPESWETDQPYCQDTSYEIFVLDLEVEFLSIKIMSRRRLQI